MSDIPDAQPLLNEAESDEVRRRHSLLSLEDMQHAVADITQQQVKRVIVITGNFIITMVALFSSAFGVIAALAWNRAISDWLPTVTPFHVEDKLAKEFFYAIVITVIGIAGIGVLGFLTSRIKGENILDMDR